MVASVSFPPLLPRSALFLKMKTMGKLYGGSSKPGWQGRQVLCFAGCIGVRGLNRLYMVCGTNNNVPYVLHL